MTDKSLDKLLKEKYGKDSVVRGNDAPKEIEVIPTGSFKLDLATGIGGIPKNRITEIFGPEQSGKSTLAMHIITECQKIDPRDVIYIDLEHALDLNYATEIGINMDQIIYSQPSSGEEALGIMETGLRSEKASCIVLDSIPAIITEAELAGDIGDAQIGRPAALLGKALKRMLDDNFRKKCALVFINQLREKIGVMFGSSETTPGGRAIKYYSSMRIDLRVTSTKAEKMNKQKNTVKATIVKNKLAPPFKEVKFDIIFGKGIDRSGEIIDVATELGIIEKSGSWYSYGEERLGQGKENTALFIKENEKLYKEIEKKIREGI